MAPTLSSPVDNAPISNKLQTSTTSDTITNTVFGLCAVVIGVLTVWQGRRLWRQWQDSTNENRSLRHGVFVP